MDPLLAEAKRIKNALRRFRCEQHQQPNPPLCHILINIRSYENFIQDLARINRDIAELISPKKNFDDREYGIKRSVKEAYKERCFQESRCGAIRQGHKTYFIDGHYLSSLPRSADEDELPF